MSEMIGVQVDRAGQELAKMPSDSEVKRTQTWHCAAILCSTVLLGAMPAAQENTALPTNLGQQDVGNAANSEVTTPVGADNKSAFDRGVTLYSILDSAGAPELKKLMEDSRNIEYESLRYETQFAIASRYASINPQEALDQCLRLPQHERSVFAEGVFAEWSESDLDGAISAAANLDRELTQVALEAIARVRDDLTATDIRAISSELRQPQFTPKWETQYVVSRHENDPLEAWSVLVQDGLGDVLTGYMFREQDGPDDAEQLDALVGLAEAAVDQKGLDAIFHLRAPIFEFESDLEGSNKILGVAVDTIVRNDPEGTWTYIQDGSPRLLSQSSEQSELERTSGVSLRDRAYMRDVVQELLLRSWATVDPATILERIEQVPRRLQPLALERALPALAETEPEQAIELIQELNHLGANSWRAVRGTVENWAAADSSAALEWVMSSPDIEQGPVPQEDLLKIVLYSVVREDPERALTFAVQQPNTDRLEAYVISHLAEFDVEAAVRLLPLVKEGAYSVATHWVATSLIENGETDRAVALYSSYEESGGDANWSMFFRIWQMENSVQLFERLDDLPPKLRYWGARTLTHYSDRNLTQEQLDYACAIRDEGEPLNP